MFTLKSHLETQLADIRKAGICKNARVIITPQGKPRIRTQILAAHTRADLKKAINVFAGVKKGIERVTGKIQLAIRFGPGKVPSAP